jgi:hypothetical protein
MPLRFATEPRNGTDLINDGLRKLAIRRSPLSERSVDFDALQPSQPHEVYDLRADAVASGGGLASAVFSGYRYLILEGNTAAAAAEIQADAEGNATLLVNINYGPYVQGTAQALTSAAALPSVSTASYETRLLRFAAAAVMALWLKSDSGGADILYPLAPAPPFLQAERPYSADEFIAAVLPLAQRRAGDTEQGRVP